MCYNKSSIYADELSKHLRKGVFSFVDNYNDQVVDTMYTLMLLYRYQLRKGKQMSIKVLKLSTTTQVPVRVTTMVNVNGKLSTMICNANSKSKNTKRHGGDMNVEREEAMRGDY